MNDQQLLTVPEVADLLGTTESHVKRLYYQRRLTYVKVGARVRFRPSDVEAFIKSNTIRQTD